MSDAHIPVRLADVVGAESDYYRNTFTPAAYVREHWARFFEVRVIAEGFANGRQDLVLLHKPSG